MYAADAPTCKAPELTGFKQPIMKKLQSTKLMLVRAGFPWCKVRRSATATLSVLPVSLIIPYLRSASSDPPNLAPSAKHAR